MGSIEPSRRRVTAGWWRPVLALLALGLLAWTVDPARLLLVLRRTDPEPLLAGVTLGLAATLVAAVLFRRILRLCGLRPTLGAVLAANLAGDFYALSLPGGAAVGGAVRLVRLAADAREVARVLAALLANRLQEVGVQLGMALLALPFVARELPLPGALALVLGSATLAAAAAYAGLFHRDARRLALLAAGPLCPRGSIRRSRLRRALAALAVLDHARTLACHAPSVALACLRFLLGCLAVVVFAHAIGSPIDLAVAMWVRGLTAVVLMLPVSIAGLGVREVSFVALLAPFGVPPAHGLVLALLVFATQLLNALPGAWLELRGGRGVGLPRAA